MSEASLLEYFVKFKTEPSIGSRTELASIISNLFNSKRFRPQEENIVKEILSFLSHDVEKSVRKAVSESLKENKDLPHEIAVRLANDIEEVSVPMLEFSEVLNDEDLQNIISGCEEVGKLLAIARRKSGVSEIISENLIETRKSNVVSILMNNRKAKISETSLEKVCDVFKNSEEVLSTLIRRGSLSPKVAEKMVSTVSAELYTRLTREYNINPLIIKSTTEAAEEKVVLGVISRNTNRVGTLELVNQLFKAGKLSHSIVLRALCRADIDFFEAGIAKLAGIPTANARKLIRAGDEKGFSALFEAASMPTTMRKAAEILLKLMIEDEERGELKKGSIYAKHMIERIVKNGYDYSVPNMQYFMALIGNAATQHNTVTLN